MEGDDEKYPLIPAATIWSKLCDSNKQSLFFSSFVFKPQLFFWANFLSLISTSFSSILFILFLSSSCVHVTAAICICHYASLKQHPFFCLAPSLLFLISLTPLFYGTKLSERVTELLTQTGWRTSGLSSAFQPQLEEELAYLLLIKTELNQLDESVPI